MPFGFQVFSADGKLQMSLTGLAYKLHAEYSFYVPPLSSWSVTPGTNGAYRHYLVTLSAPDIADINDWEVIWITSIQAPFGWYFSPWPWSVTLSAGQINIRMAAGYNYTQKIYLVKKT